MNFGKYIQRRTEKTFVFDTCDHAFNDAVLHKSRDDLRYESLPARLYPIAPFL